MKAENERLRQAGDADALDISAVSSTASQADEDDDAEQTKPQHDRQAYIEQVPVHHRQSARLW